MREEIIRAINAEQNALNNFYEINAETIENTEIKNITVTAATADRLENLVYYYRHHTVEKIQERHPGFIVDDFEQVLKILSIVLDV